jgi:DNA-binding NtrC family response regulator
MLRLAVRSDDGLRVFEVPEGEAVLGSSAGADLRAPFRGVSRRHALIRPHANGILVSDTGSKNGLVRGGRRFPEIVLLPGESVQLGEATLHLEEIPSGEAELGLRLASATPSRTPDRDDAETPDTASELAPREGASPSSALSWARRHAAGPEVPAEADFEVARRALGAESLLLLETRGGPEGHGILRLAGRVPAREELDALAERHAHAGPAGTTSFHLAGGELALVAAGRDEAVPALLAALLPAGSRKAKAWQLDFFDYLADVAFAGAPERRRSAPEIPRDELVRNAELIFPVGFVAGTSPAIRNLLGQVRATVGSSLDVLLLGETGTGKELFARMIHASGPTAKGPFVAINCAAIPDELLEAQLFGVEGRIATGVDPRVGLFQKADGGAIFLDEIGELPSALQAKLLRVLQEREVLPLGAHAPRRVRIRVISASNKDLEREVRHGRFRADLYYRLRGLQFHLPPLRDRPDDIPALVSHFVHQAAAEHGRRIAGVSRKALELLQTYDWPGNVRELRSEIDRAVLIAEDGASLTSDQFGGVRWHLERLPSGEVVLPDLAAGPSRRPDRAADAPHELGAARDRLERQMIEDALRKTGGNQSRAAKLLGITRNGLALKMKRLGLAAHPEGG